MNEVQKTLLAHAEQAFDKALKDDGYGKKSQLRTRLNIKITAAEIVEVLRLCEARYVYACSQEANKQKQRELRGRSLIGWTAIMHAVGAEMQRAKEKFCLQFSLPTGEVIYSRIHPAQGIAHIWWAGKLEDEPLHPVVSTAKERVLQEQAVILQARYTLGGDFTPTTQELMAFLQVMEELIESLREETKEGSDEWRNFYRRAADWRHMLIVQSARGVTLKSEGGSLHMQYRLPNGDVILLVRVPGEKNRWVDSSKKLH